VVRHQDGDSDSEWLLELCKVERRADDADDKAADEFLDYLLEHHRPSGPRDSGPSVPVVPLRQPAPGPLLPQLLGPFCHSSWAPLATVPGPCLPLPQPAPGRFLPRSWDELVRFATAPGPLLPVAVPAGHVVIRSLPQAQDGNHHSVFAHCCRQLAAWFAAIGPIVFKVGIAADPGHRFWNPEFGYETERAWHFMDVVWSGPANESRQLEIDLISAFRGLPGCRNVSAGGDGVRPDRKHLCFTYLVVAECGHGLPLGRAWAKRRRLMASG